MYIIPLVASLNDRPSTYFWNSDEEHDEAQLRGHILCAVMTFMSIAIPAFVFRLIDSTSSIYSDGTTRGYS